MPELTATLTAMRDVEHRKNKFLGAIQGIDIDEGIEKDTQVSSFEDIKARVFSGGQAKDSSDILSLQGLNAQQVGFGIGLGLEYSNLKEEPEGPW